MIFLAAWFFLLGLVMGSFYNVVIYRVPRGESVVRPPSHCPSCGERLRPAELVPLFSYLWQRGRCRHCGAAISRRYLLVELGTGLLFFAVFLLTGPVPQVWPRLALASLLLVAAATDLDCRRIPNAVVAWGAAGGVAFALLGLERTLPEAFWGALAGGLPLLMLGLLSRGGMGGGDIKLMAAAGLYLGPGYALLAIFLGSLLGAAVGLALLAAGRLRRRQPIPFGPFLAAGCLISLFWGSQVWTWYWQMLTQVYR